MMMMLLNKLWLRLNRAVGRAATGKRNDDVSQLAASARYRYTRAQCGLYIVACHRAVVLCFNVPLTVVASRLFLDRHL